MKLILFFIPTVFVCSNITLAADSNLCEEAAKYTCSIGIHDDGTGSITKGAGDVFQDMKDRTAKALLSESKVMKDKIAAMVSNPDNAFFRNSAIAAFNLSDSPECQSTDSADQKNCTDNLISGLSVLADKSLEKAGGSAVGYAYGGGNTTPSMDELNVDLAQLQWVKDNAGFKQIVDESKNEILNKYVDRSLVKRIREKVFPQIKNLLVKKLESLPIDEAQKKIMISKVKNIQYTASSCGEGVSNAFYPNAFYNPLENGFTVCSGFLTENRSEFNIAMVVGHELAHSIDPCDIQLGAPGNTVLFKSKTTAEAAAEYPIKGLISCLRSIRSVNARSLTGYGEQKGMVFCNTDQIGEAMSDWFGDDLMADYISANYPNLTKAQWQNGMANTFKPMCVSAAMAANDVHPPTPDRINRLLITNPKIREKMGCTKSNSKYIHCDANNPDAMAQAIAAPMTQAEVDANSAGREKTESQPGVR